MSSRRQPKRSLARRTAPLAAPALLTALALLAAPAAADPREGSAAATTGCEPQGELRGDPDAGMDLHASHCATCHGIDGSGSLMTLQGDAQARDQSDPDFMSTLTDEYLYRATCAGGEAVGLNFVMPAWGQVLSDQDIKDLIAWIRSFSGT